MVNGEGMTWPEWFHAAVGAFDPSPAVYTSLVGGDGKAYADTLSLRKAWRNGECPTDWRASLSSGRVLQRKGV